MMNLHISPLGWVGIALIGFIIISLNVSLISAIRNHDLSRTMDILRKTNQATRQPWKKEDQMLKDLSAKVEELKKGKKP
jgi:hypothetical protein